MLLGAHSSCKPNLFFGDYIVSLGFKSIPDDFQHNFARITGEADSSVVLADSPKGEHHILRKEMFETLLIMPVFFKLVVIVVSEGIYRHFDLISFFPWAWNYVEIY